jgi:hypothetical protein
MTKVYVGDVGTQIVLDCGAVVTSSTARSIEARKPDGTTVSWDAAVEGANSIKVTTSSGTLNVPGTWRLQAKVTMPSGIWLGETVTLQVHPRFG